MLTTEKFRKHAHHFAAVLNLSHALRFAISPGRTWANFSKINIFVFGLEWGPDLTSLQQHGSSKRHMAVACGVMGDAARHTTTRRTDRPSTPPIPRGCLLTPCGIRTRVVALRARAHTLHVHSHAHSIAQHTRTHLRQHVRARMLFRTCTRTRTSTRTCTARALAPPPTTSPQNHRLDNSQLFHPHP